MSTGDRRIFLNHQQYSVLVTIIAMIFKTCQTRKNPQSKGSLVWFFFVFVFVFFRSYYEAEFRNDQGPLG